MSLPSFRRVDEFLDGFQPDLLHVHTEGALGRGPPLCPAPRAAPRDFVPHQFSQYSRYYGVGLLEPAVWRWLERFHRPARLTFTPGEAVRNELVGRGIAHAAVWGRGVDTRFFHPARRDAGWRRWLAGGDDTVIVLHVGRLAREKNLAVLIDAWHRARVRLGQRATFVVAGEGPLARRIQSQVPFVRMLGFLPRETLATLYASADLCVFPSHTETCGLVALEAMSSGVPVIAADAGGFRESIRAGVTGLLVPPRDPHAYATATATLATDAAGRFAAAAAAREHALTRDTTHEDGALLARYAELAETTQPRTAPCAA